MNHKKQNIRLGISACLLGQKVRYDGGHTLDSFLKDTLGAFVEYVPVCPEVECGMSVPREPLRLKGSPDMPSLVTVLTKKDYTDQMVSWARRRVRELDDETLCGYIFKSRSPSCGMECVKVYNDSGNPAKNGAGIFARVFMEHFPLLTVEEEGRLQDPVLRENFIERIFVFRRWRELLAQKKSAGALVDFHTRHKLLLLSHSTQHYRIMGKLVADAKKIGLPEAYGRYQQLLMGALCLKPTVKKHVNVLQHMMGYFKTLRSPDEKKELLGIIEQYRHELVPLIVPLTLINHYVRKYNQQYLNMQYYLNPHPVELRLKNHV